MTLWPARCAAVLRLVTAAGRGCHWYRPVDTTHRTALQYTAQHYIELHCTALHCTALHCTEQNCTSTEHYGSVHGASLRFLPCTTLPYNAHYINLYSELWSFIWWCVSSAGTTQPVELDIIKSIIVTTRYDQVNNCNHCTDLQFCFFFSSGFRI